ncbi:transposase [Lachnoclostridium sp. An181]|uniref:transposase n=1 Tax=Lachnoclostridium sp. An181 TaxID=1965575 RepID=UPI001179D8EA
MYGLKIRIIRVKISDTLSETILTNVPRNEFPPEIVKELYKLHWSIETAFKE